MRLYLSTLLLVLICAFGAIAQNAPEKKAKQTKQKIDSLKTSVEDKADSLIKIPQAKNALDSLTDKVSNTKNPLDSLSDKVSNIKNPLDSVAGKITNVENPLDSISNKISSTTQAANDSIRKLSELPQRKLDSLQSKLQKKVNDLDTLNKLDQVIDEKLQNSPLDKLDAPELELPEMDGQVDGLNKATNLDGKLNTDLPTQEIEGLTDGLTKEIKDIDAIEDAGKSLNKLDKLKAAPKEQLDKLKNTDQLKNAQGQLNKINEVGEKANRYQEDIKNVTEGKLDEVKSLPEDLEGKAGNLKELKELKKQSAEFDKLKQEQEKYKQQAEKYQDKDYVKQQIQNKAKQLATDHFAKHQDKLKAAQDKLSKYKKKYPGGIQSTKDLPKKRPNPLKGKPFIERVVPGFTLQALRREKATFDLSPQVSYLLSDRWRIGVGGTYRVDVDRESFHMSNDQNVYGFRNYVEFNLIKGFFLHGEFDALRTDVPNPLAVGPDDRIIRKWIFSPLVGIGKSYSFAKQIRGTMLVMHNFGSGIDSPYPNKVIVKFGFDLKLKKSKNKKSTK
ncbi:MAG: hypothetical protein AAFX87_02825 [Bacteroidota bacterium]